MQQTNIFSNQLLKDAEHSIYWNNLHGGSRGLALSEAIKQSKRPFLIILENSLHVSRLIEELNFFGNDEIAQLIFPDWETLPYDHFSPHEDIISERLASLYRIPSMDTGAIITTIPTLMYRLPPREYLESFTFLLKLGDQLNLDHLRTRLVHAGYHVVSQVREHGEFAIRGSIIDIFPMGNKTPYRIDLFDNEVDSIRIFSPDTQRSLHKINEIKLLPAKEFPLTDEAIEFFRQNFRKAFSGNPLKCPIYQDISEGISPPGIEYYLPFFFEKTNTLFDYLPSQTIFVTIGEIETKAKEFWQEILMRYEQSRFDISRPILPPNQLFLQPESLNEQIKTYASIKINVPREVHFVSSSGPTVNVGSQKEKSNVIQFKTTPTPIFNIDHKVREPLAPLLQFLTDYNGRVLFCAETLGRREVILQLFRSISLHPTFFPSWQAFLQSSEQYGIVVTQLEEGFCLEEPPLTLLTESTLYGQRIMQRRLRKKSVQDTDALIRNLTELRVDDPVVHIDHGVGRYLGLETLKVGDQVAEFLCLAYQDNDKLYVPVASLHLISRYTGADPEHVPINKLGSVDWQKAKRKAELQVRDVAAELLDLYAKRASHLREVYRLPDELYNTFAAGFPFEETPDQLQAIQAVIADMTSEKPMDRVICGDVGFGKTEVALRAAFLAIQNNKQVALLVPTTLLAQQHFDNFRNRLADWPIRIELLSRFRTKGEQTKVLNDMENGKIDIVIGTHKLLQNDIKWRSLGLIIIDEEHRFGVKQKEKLKTLRANVDILTLTATPIPRTLNMALSGIRDLSLIATPPARRLSVKTFVHDYQNGIIEEAILREILRGGQVYFLHNDISTIDKKAEEIANLVPTARVSVAHGQMHKRDLERIMSDFYHRRINVLICSTIIESGIDVPTANTIIINRADKFGLAQLHQLRGRVGRSHHQAYAYLLIPAKDYITSDAKKRLDAIASLDDLGIGFSLATHDLEIRGAGELLGEEQSGEMHEIGFTLYMDLLSRAVDALKTGSEPDFDQALLLKRGSEVDLHVTALIPADYLNDVQLRLQFYKRIANAENSAALDDIQVELIDRFGLVPPQLKTLFAISELRLKAKSLGILKLEANEKGGRIEFSEKPHVNPETIIRLIQTESQKFRLEAGTRLRFVLDKHDIKDRMVLVDKILDKLSR